jgi:hypothetical protein
VKTPAARREAILDEFERSGMSGAAFAGYIGMKCQTLASWVQRRRRGRRASASGEASPGDAPVRWVEVLPGGDRPAGGAPLVVRLGEARMEVADRAGAALAAEILARLPGARGC